MNMKLEVTHVREFPVTEYRRGFDRKQAAKVFYLSFILFIRIMLRLLHNLKIVMCEKYAVLVSSFLAPASNSRFKKILTELVASGKSKKNRQLLAAGCYLVLVCFKHFECCFFICTITNGNKVIAVFQICHIEFIEHMVASY